MYQVTEPYGIQVHPYDQFTLSLTSFTPGNETFALLLEVTDLKIYKTAEIKLEPIQKRTNVVSVVVYPYPAAVRLQYPSTDRTWELRLRRRLNPDIVALEHVV